jgi:hypothetical protein
LQLMSMLASLPISMRALQRQLALLVCIPHAGGACSRLAWSPSGPVVVDCGNQGRRCNIAARGCAFTTLCMLAFTCRLDTCKP